MFCADYIASFIHHGLIVGLWFEYNERSGRQDLTSAYVPPVHSVLAGCLAGEVTSTLRRELTDSLSQDCAGPPRSTLSILSDRVRLSRRRSASVTVCPRSPTPGLTSASTSAAGTERGRPARPAGLSSPPPPPAWRRYPLTRPSRL